MNHSNIVGGSTAKRVMACPGSVALVNQMPKRPSNEHADRGTLLHNVIAEALEHIKPLQDFIGTTYEKQTLTPELLDEKLRPAIEALNEIDPNQEMEYAVETRVGFGDFLPGVFGSTDLLGRIGNRAIVLDWKFGDGVMVEAQENPQMLFYAAAAMRTDKTKWVFAGADEIECIIVQPPFVRRWVTTRARVEQFELELARAVKIAQQADAPLKIGDHCRWCTAKPICPQMTGIVERTMQTQVAALDKNMIAQHLANAEILENWIKDMRALAFQVLESGSAVPGYKLVAKRATRSWADESKAVELLGDAAFKKEIVSPAQAEKLLKTKLPPELVVSISSGSTLAEESDPRPAVLQIGKQITAALSKLQ